MNFLNGLEDFNARSNISNYVKTWNTLYDISVYQESGPDNSNYEKGFNGKASPVFPYDLKDLMASNEGFDIIKTSPFGNTMITDFALSAIEAEGLGDDAFTDFLTVSYSSTDYVGHNFGLSSVELQDTYLRLDLEIERLLNYLDENVGEGNYTLFLTADHGAAEVPAYLRDINVPGANIAKDDFSPLFDAMTAKYGASGSS